MTGLFQTSRAIFDNPIWQNVVEFRLFFLIYGNACFKDNVTVAGVTLKRGQWLRSYRNLQKDLEYKEKRATKQYSLDTIYRAVKNLSKQNRITIIDCDIGTLFEVVNYAKYQCFDEIAKDKPNAYPNTNRTATEQQPNKKKNAKNAKKDITNVISTPKSDFDTALDAFIEMRIKRKSPMTEHAIDLLKKHLIEFSPDEAIQTKILNQSIRKGWTDVYPLSEGGAKNDRPTTVNNSDNKTLRGFKSMPL